ncbi:hypothetical protein K491DRAFT_784462 [Lophiostoma macrostomum CBS 122681]|uniref:Chromosome segregation ATPase family protein n=1 Tax=Lophiostoma macrostomum CBS 122681 TaxID=1314788 RepID=A0A6A6SJT4_9PLEO|nr:hypothetical protein K491DRAFT_784462 [Lophiostoma macrostomum CBS 122681]
MSSSDRDSSRDRELVRHSHSFSSDGSRAHIPMWDSSDPERAPPPLPLNPGSPNLTTRPNTSAAIANAARALEEKARESLPASSYTTNPLPQRSPERSLIKGAQHKRMQSLQTTNVRDLKSFLDGVRSPERSPERPSTRGGTPAREMDKDYFSGDMSPSRTATPTPSGRDIFKDTPALRPSSRPLQKAILGENTPPSATMLALQTMTIPREHLEPPLANITNSSSSSRTPQASAPTFDAISNQLLSITTIVSNLQKDMTQLSRRSKDNATDLISLKEATSSRDEDIRKSLKDLVVTMSNSGSTAGTPGGHHFKDPHMTPTKQFTLPRIPSPNSFMMDERIGSPNPYSVEGAASVAMLEKIIREMVTKDGQERLIANLQTLVDKATGDTAKKVAELVEFVKQGSASHALVSSAAQGSASFQPSPGSGALTRAGDLASAFPLHKVADGGKPYASPKAADFVSEEMLKFLRKIKDSVAESGCVTMGTKAMIQDLRGEVLGMGRELARKIEEVEQTSVSQRAIEPGQSHEEVALVVQEGLANIKQHMDQVMRDRRRQSISSTVTRNTVDSQEVYDVVKHALAERGLDQISAPGAMIDKEAIIATMRDAFEAYKPDLEFPEGFGLEKEEVLQCLREGLHEYRGAGGVTKEEVEHIIQDAIQHVKLPPPINEAHEVREEVLMAVRECLDDLKPSLVSYQPQSDSLSREAIMDAVRLAMAENELNIDLPPEMITEAVRLALDASPQQPGGHADAVVMQHLQALVDDMHSEFKAYSSANGRDTEQVLDALKDGLDTLRAEIESYVDKAQDVTHKDEIIDNIRGELESLRVDVQAYVAEGPRGDHAWNRGDMVTYIKSEFEHLHEELSSQFLPAANDKEDIITALNAGFEGMKSQVVTRGEDLDTNEEINEAMKQEFDQLKDAILGDTVHQKEEIIETLQTGFDGLHARLTESTASAGSNDEVLVSIKEEFEHLRETLGGTLVRSGGSADKDDIIDAVRELIDGLRSQVTVAQEDSSKEGLASIHEEIEQLKESLSNTLVHSGESLDKEEILDALRTGLEDIKAGSSSIGVNEELLEAFRGELEQVRQSNGLTRQHARADTEEVLEAVRLGLDDLRSHMEKKLDNPEQHTSATNEIIDSLNEGLESLRSDVTKIVDKPVDMTVSYEILDTLKEGIAGLREDIEKIKGTRELSETEDDNEPTGNEVVLAEDPDSSASREIVSESLRRNDLEKMEVMLAQLQIKVEAMDANIQNPIPAPPTDSVPPTGSAMKDDLVGIEDLLKDLQAAVVTLQEREPGTASLEGMASKEDTDAIETLLGNVKAKIDEIILPDPATLVTKENFDDVELVVRTTSETIEELSKKFAEEGATKGDVAVVQVIVDDIKVILDEMKAAKPEEEELSPKATKDDIDSLAVLVCDIKAKVEEMKIPDAEELPSKADLEQLTGLIHDFRDSHEKLRDSYENDVAITAKAFDDRKKEAKELVDNMAEVRLVLDDVKEEIKTNLTEGAALEGIKESFKALEDTMGASLNINADVKELMETVSREFERAHGAIEGLHNGQEEKSALALEKHDEAKDAIVAGLVEKVDDRFNTLMTKYDDAQLLADEQARAMKEKAEEQEKILESTKAMADELKLTIDTLGASITGMHDRFTEATEKLTTDSATVFGKIDETMAKLEEQKLDDKTEHSHTRDEIANVERIFNGLQDNVTEYHPKFMVTLREIEALVKAHYEHSQKSKEAADEQVRTMNEEARTRAQELSDHFSSLPALLPAPPSAIEPAPTYDDTQLQEKLDKIIGHADEAEKTTAQLERLDEIHKQVMTTAAEVTDFVAKQTQLITDGNEAKEREAEEIGLVLERRRTQKEQVEADIESLKAEKERLIEELKAEKERAMAELKEEKDRTLLEVKEEKHSLLAVVAALQVERENLANQKVRLTGEVSSLHTALDIRREELDYMDAKADALERRILNGIMDHSRALMIAKGGPKASGKPKKRMSAIVTDDATKLMPPPSTAASALNMALKPRPAIRRNGPPANPASRRILSLSQISGNTPTGAQAYPVNGNVMNNTSNLKRSHSVKTNYLRKSSWGGRPSVAIANKENEALSEEDEIEAEPTPASVQADDNHSTIEEEYPESETGTERRHSFVSGSYEGSYAEGETPGYDGRSSFGGTGSDYTYASGSSYMTGSDIDRRTSYGSTAARSTLAGGETIDEGSEDEASHHSEAEDDDGEPTTTVPPPALTPSDPNTEPAPSELAPSEVTASEVSTALPTQSEVDAAVEAVKDELKNDMRIYGPPSDSGVGTDLPTALIGNESEADADYFRRQAEEEASLVG